MVARGLPLVVIMGCSTTSTGSPRRPMILSLPGVTTIFLLSTHMMRLQGGSHGGGTQLGGSMAQRARCGNKVHAAGAPVITGQQPTAVIAQHRCSHHAAFIPTGYCSPIHRTRPAT